MGWHVVVVGPDLTITGPEQLVSPWGGACTLRPGAWTDPPNKFGVLILSDIVHETSPADMTTKSPITAPTT